MYGHFPFPILFGYHTKCKFGSGEEENGPKILPAAHSFASSVSMMCGCLKMDARLLAFIGLRGLSYPGLTPHVIPRSSQETQALLG